jgi:AcrR family transcriptional regulator/DNA-binding PadR family transcriptional regulator
MAADEDLRTRYPAPVSGGGLYVSELQRGRLLDAAFGVVAEQGYRGMVVRAVAERAGVSSKTFYDLFSDREDCFLAAFDYGVQRLADSARPAYEQEQDWVAGIRGGLGALLAVLDREPALRKLLFVEALGAGSRVLARRGEVLQELTGLVDEGRVDTKTPGDLPGLMAESVVGATVGVIHSRLLQEHPEPLLGLLGELTAMIVLPYRGRAASARELTRPAPQIVADALPDTDGETLGGVLGAGAPVDFRLTVRSQTVLLVVAECPGLNNQQVSERAGISDQGQISRLMIRLQEQGLLENTRAHLQGHSKAWRLTAEGEDVVQANPPPRHKHRSSSSASCIQVSPRAATYPSADSAEHSALGAALPLRTRAHLVLAAVSGLGTRDMAPSNREISEAVGVTDQGQISKLLARLERQGLLRNTARRTQGVPNAWRLTPRGEAALHTGRSENTNPIVVEASQ